MGRSLAFGPAAHAGPACLSAALRLFPRAAPDRVRARSPRGRHAPATHAVRQPRPTSPSTRSPSSAAPAALPTSPSRSLRSSDSSSARPLSPPNAAAAPPATYPPSTPSFFDSRRQQLRLGSLPRLRSLAVAVVEVRAELGRLLSLRRVRCRGRVDCHATGPTPPSQSVRLSVVCMLAPSAPPEELAAGEHRSAGLLPCSRVTNPWGRRAQPQWPVEVSGAQHRVHPAFFDGWF